jgi:predicted small lipoprotein YifL
MKKSVCLSLLVVLLILSIASCGPTEAPPAAPTEKPAESQPTGPPAAEKVSLRMWAYQVAGYHFTSSDPAAFDSLAGIRQRGGDYWNADQTGFTFNTPEAKATLE